MRQSFTAIGGKSSAVSRKKEKKTSAGKHKTAGNYRSRRPKWTYWNSFRQTAYTQAIANAPQLSALKFSRCRKRFDFGRYFCRTPRRLGHALGASIGLLIVHTLAGRRTHSTKTTHCSTYDRLESIYALCTHDSDVFVS